MRRSDNGPFHIYELEIASSALHQLTEFPFADDTEPVYLPNGDIVFVSTRNHTCHPVTGTPVRNLYRMDGDGANIHRIGIPGQDERHPTVLTDGRILYCTTTNFHAGRTELRTTNPDGTNHLGYWKPAVQTPVALSMVQPIPETQQIIGIAVNEQSNASYPALIDRNRTGMAIQRFFMSDATQSDRTTGGSLPPSYSVTAVSALTDSLVLLTGYSHESTRYAVYLADRHGVVQKVYTNTDGISEAVPVIARTPAPIIPDRVSFDEKTGELYLLDVRYGLDTTLFDPDTILSLMICASSVQPYRLTSNSLSTSCPWTGWNSNSITRVLGTVPVATDGSAYLSLPPDCPIAIQLIDQHGVTIANASFPRMVLPGETTGAVSLIDNPASTPPLAVTKVPLAVIEEPLEPSRAISLPDTYNFMRDIQPILNDHCIQCHTYEAKAAKALNLAPDRTLLFNTAYESLFRNGLVYSEDSDMTNSSTMTPSGHSALMDTLHAGHKEIMLDSGRIGLINRWISCNAPYYDTHQSAYRDNPGGRSPLQFDELVNLSVLCGIPVDQFLHPSMSSGALISFDHPHYSLCLSGIDSTSSAYRDITAIIETGRQRLNKHPRADMPGFMPPSESDNNRSQHWSYTDIESRFRSAIIHDEKLYDHDIIPHEISETRNNDALR